MPLWDRVKTELDRAGRAAELAIDEGKLRLEVIRARQLAEQAAQALGYAVYRARKEGKEVEPDTYARLAADVPMRVVARTLAPAKINICASAASPLMAAQCNAVVPSPCASLTSRPFFNSALTASLSPAAAAAAI